MHAGRGLLHVGAQCVSWIGLRSSTAFLAVGKLLEKESQHQETVWPCK